MRLLRKAKKKKNTYKTQLPFSIRLLLRKCLETFIETVGDRWPLNSLGNVFINGNTVQAAGTKHTNKHRVKSK